MWAVPALLLALCPAAVAVRLARDREVINPSDIRLALEVRANRKTAKSEACRSKLTPKMCRDSGLGHKYTAAAIVSVFQEDLGWLNEMPWSDNLTVMVHDRSSYRTHDSKNRFADSDAVSEESEASVKALNLRRTTPIKFKDIPNKGDEAAAYLRWIVEHYEHLPDVSFFLQGHDCDAHAPFDMSVALPSIRQCFRPEQGYLDINTYGWDSATECQQTQEVITNPIQGFHLEKFVDIWNDLFYLELGPMPTKICWDSFAQFAVSRERILSHPKDFYETLLQGVLSGQTTMEFFWRAIFVPDAISWQVPPKKDRFGHVIIPEYHFSKEEELENARHVDLKGQVKDLRNPL